MLTNWLISNLTIRDIGNAIDESWNFSLEKYKSWVSERYTKQLFANNVRKDE